MTLKIVFFFWTLFELLQWNLSLTKYRSKLIGKKSLVNTIAWYFEIFKILISELIKRNLKLIYDYFIYLTAWNRYCLSIKEEICGMESKNLCQEKLWKNHSHRNICTFYDYDIDIWMNWNLFKYKINISIIILIDAFIFQMFV